MWLAIKHGLANLLNFHGRDARQAFWFYALFVYLITFAIGMLVSIPMTVQSMMIVGQMTMAHAGDPQASAGIINAAMAQNMKDFAPALLGASFASGLILLAGLGAAFVRRLHDSALSGYWALIPAALQIFALAMAPAQMERATKLMTEQMTNPAPTFNPMQNLGSGALIGWLPIVLVIALGVRKSTEGPNRYGDAPFIA